MPVILATENEALALVADWYPVREFQSLWNDKGITVSQAGKKLFSLPSGSNFIGVVIPH